MTEQIALRSPELLHIEDAGRLCLGAEQEWYGETWQRRAGCGPTSAAHLLCYLARTRSCCQALIDSDCRYKEDFVALMEQVWQYVTPGKMGVNSIAMLREGALRYGAERGVQLQARELAVAAKPLARRPDAEELTDFLAQALADDLPVAFLNLASGAVANLDSWHWVTLVALDIQNRTATMYDQGREAVINIGLWLRTSVLGGGLVAIEPAAAG